MNKIDLNNKTILVTGSSGFIGSNLCLRLLKEYNSSTIIGLDNMNNYYDVSLKEYRLSKLKDFDNFIFAFFIVFWMLFQYFGDFFGDGFVVFEFV